MPSVSLLEDLSAALPGQVFAPSSDEYARRVIGFNQAVRHAPDVVVEPRSPDDVAAAVRIATAHHAPVTPFGEGHGFLNPVDSGVLLAMRSMHDVHIDPDTSVARIVAGTKWQEVADAALPWGLMPLAGTDAGVGAVGYLLGGGLGPLGRSYGYAADHVVSIDLVTGLGEMLTVTADSHPELFWALRGGNHHLGIVTAISVKLVRSDDVHGVAQYYRAADIEVVLRAWASWSQDLPASMNTYATIVRMPDDDDVPGVLRAQTILQTTHIFVGAITDRDALLAPLLEVAEPLWEEPGRIRDDTLPDMPVTDGGLFLASLDDAAIDVILDAAGPQVDLPVVSVGLQRLGGALDAEPSGGSAVAGRGAAYSIHLIGDIPELVETALPVLIQEFHASLEPWVAPGCLPNYIGRANAAGSLDRAWTNEATKRLSVIRSAHDPHGLFRHL